MNAYYEPTANEICVPAGILQAPFWVNGAPDYINLGAIGVVLGHELSHAFDSNGRQYDEDGQLRDWWSSEASEKYSFYYIGLPLHQIKKTWLIMIYI